MRLLLAASRTKEALGSLSVLPFSSQRNTEDPTTQLHSYEVKKIKSSKKNILLKIKTTNGGLVR